MSLKPDARVLRLLGAAFLFVLVASALSTALVTSVTGSGSTSEVLVSVADNAVMMRVSVLIGLFTSLGIVVLAVLLYVVLREQNKIMALVALGMWLGEAVTLAVSKIGASALIPLSQQFTEGAAPGQSHLQPLADFLHHGVYQQGDDIHMLFYCVGGILWFCLLLKSRLIPRELSLFGIAVESLGLIGTILLFLVAKVEMWFFYPIALLELATGLTLVFKRARSSTERV